MSLTIKKQQLQNETIMLHKELIGIENTPRKLRTPQSECTLHHFI